MPHPVGLVSKVGGGSEGALTYSTVINMVALSSSLSLSLCIFLLASLFLIYLTPIHPISLLCLLLHSCPPSLSLTPTLLLAPLIITTLILQVHLVYFVE